MRLRFAFLALLCSLLLPRAARAQQPASQPAEKSSVNAATERATRAKELNKQGIAMLDAGDLERALDYFLQSRKVLPTTKNTTNAAIVLEKLGRYDQALELYEELLLKFAGGLGDEDREAIAPAMAELRPKVGGLEVTSNVGGTVQIDGRERGKLPLLSPVRVLPGKHDIRVIQPGYRDFEAKIEVGAGETKPVDAKLSPIPGVGILQIVDTESVAVDVYVDGTKLGTTPWEGALSAGKHLVWLQNDAVGSVPAWVEVIEGQAAISKLQARPLGPPIEVHAEPGTAALEIAGVTLAGASWSGRLPEGSYVVRASEEGYVTKSLKIGAKRGGAPIDVTLALEIDPAHPRWPQNRGAFLAELIAGGMIGPSLNGDADEGCPNACPSRSPAYGFLVGARGGYRFPVGIAVEFGAGYMRLMQQIERTESGSFNTYPNGPEPVAVPITYSLKDDILVQGPFAMVGASYRHTIGMLHLGTRANVGVLVTVSRDPVSGTAKTNGADAPLYVTDAYAMEISAAPFLQPELNVGLALGPVDLGLALGAAFFPALGPGLDRGKVGVDGTPDRNNPSAVENAPESSVVDDERAYGRFVAFTPAITLGADF